MNDVSTKNNMSDAKKKVDHLAIFKQRTKTDDNAEMSEVTIISARKTGNLNLSSRGLFTAFIRRVQSV